jgi:ABC-type transport system substrate-binding protein
MRQMTTTLDRGKQESAGRQLDRYVHEEALSLFTYQRIKTYGVSKSVRFVPTVTGMSYYYLSAPGK